MRSRSKVHKILTNMFIFRHRLKDFFFLFSKLPTLRIKQEFCWNKKPVFTATAMVTRLLDCFAFFFFFPIKVSLEVNTNIIWEKKQIKVSKLTIIRSFFRIGSPGSDCSCFKSLSIY